MFNTIIPTLRVKDSRKAEMLFLSLGFKPIWDHKEDESSPRFVELGRDRVSVFLSEHNGDGPFGIYIYFLVEDAAALHEQAKVAGLNIADALHPTEWGHEVFEIEDEDGNTLKFGSPLKDGELT